MPHAKVYIHFVWTTKNRIPFLDTYDLRKNLWNHIRDNAKSKGIFIDSINGYQEHCHCLISLGIEQSMANVMRLLKGESSYWINKNHQFKHRFEWQNEYFAVSVSESLVDKVRNYIDDQEQHHRKKPFQNEYDELIELSDFRKII